MIHSNGSKRIMDKWMDHLMGELGAAIGRWKQPCEGPIHVAIGMGCHDSQPEKMEVAPVLQRIILTFKNHVPLKKNRGVLKIGIASGASSVLNKIVPVLQVSEPPEMLFQGPSCRTPAAIFEFRNLGADHGDMFGLNVLTLGICWTGWLSSPTPQKNTKVNWDIDIPNWMDKWISCSKPPTSYVWLQIIHRDHTLTTSISVDDLPRLLLRTKHLQTSRNCWNQLHSYILMLLESPNQKWLSS